MNDETRKEKQSRAGIDYIVTLDELEKCEINLLLEEIKGVDCPSIERHLTNLKKQKLIKESNALNMLITMAKFCLVPDDKNPFKPEWDLGEERASMPSDFKKKQIDIIAEFTPKVENPGLRARLADVSWFIQKHRDMAEIAVNAYCESVERVKKGEAVFDTWDSSIIGDSSCDDSAWGENAKDLMKRAAKISDVIKWKLEVSKRFKRLMTDLLETADKRKDGWGFYLMGTISFEYENKILPIKQLAEMTEGLAEKLDTRPDLQSYLFCLAEKAYKEIKNEKKVKKCVIAKAECCERKADISRSEMEAEENLENAILLLKRYPHDTEKKRRNLRDRLQKIRDSIIKKEGKIFSVEGDLGWVIEESVNSIRNLPWPDAFYSIIQCDYALPNPDEFRKMAFECAQKTPSQTLFRYGKSDNQGRVMFRADEKDEHLHYLVNFFRGIHRQGIVQGVINPKREIIASEHQFSNNNKMITELLQDKPFIADGHKDIYVRGISHFLCGNNIEAASLLVPQLENSLKHILALEGHDTTEIHDKDDQPEASLHILLNPKKEWRKELEKILPVKYVLEIDFLFNFSGGPSIRKKVAHGMMSDIEFQEANCIYAVWLIIHLAIFFPKQLSK